MQVKQRIDKHITIEPKVKYAAVKYDVGDNNRGFLELSQSSVEKIYEFARTLPLKHGDTFVFGGDLIDINVQKGHAQGLADLIRELAYDDFRDILDQDDAVLLQDHRWKTNRCRHFGASYCAVKRFSYSKLASKTDEWVKKHDPTTDSK